MKFSDGQNHVSVSELATTGTANADTVLHGDAEWDEPEGIVEAVVTGKVNTTPTSFVVTALTASQFSALGGVYTANTWYVVRG